METNPTVPPVSQEDVPLAEGVIHGPVTPQDPRYPDYTAAAHDSFGKIYRVTDAASNGFISQEDAQALRENINRSFPDREGAERTREAVDFMTEGPNAGNRQY